MRTYDVALVLRDTTTTAREKVLEQVKKWMGDGKIVKTEDLGKKNLAYPIKKQTEGYYLLLDVQSETGLKADFEKRLIMDEAVLRHLVVRKN